MSPQKVGQGDGSIVPSDLVADQRKRSKRRVGIAENRSNYMINTLLYCCEKKIPASIYCDPSDRQKHYTGYIEKVNKNEILIAHISNNGYYDGYVLRPTEDIYRIDYDGEYEKRIDTLYKARRQTHNVLFIISDKESLFLSALRAAKENDLVVSLILDDDCRTGWIKGYDNDVVLLRALNDNGEKDGIAIVRVSDVDVLEIDTDYEQDLRLLSEHRGRLKTD